MCTRTHPRGSSGGFTLLELMFALTIMAVGVMAAFMSQMGSMSLMRTAEEQEIILTDLQTCVEEMLSLNPEDLPLSSSEYTDGESIAAYEELHLRDERIVATYPEFTGGDVPDPLVIRLSASWTDFDGHPRSLDLVTAVTR
ncbi:MAG: type IV pilus modification PilV family protein [Planctomycetota bacterium]|jgi:prepilin-type N-terminal cleavage/methylation domain-containing protein